MFSLQKQKIDIFQFVVAVLRAIEKRTTHLIKENNEKSCKI